MKAHSYVFVLNLLVVSVFLNSCGKSSSGSIREIPREEQQTDGLEEKTHSGRNVLRFETFGNEGFWTDAARLPKGIVDNNVTPVQALGLGLSVNAEALDAATQKAVVEEIKRFGTKGPILNDPATTIALLNANAVIGVVVKDTNRDGKLDVASGDKVGVSCVLCHAITDGSAYKSLHGGSIGKQIDGPAAHNINIGKILALADNTKAFFPNAQLMGANGKSIGRAPSDRGLTKNSSEAEFDAYFSNPNFYPVGTFDDTVDGNGNSMHNTPLFSKIWQLHSVGSGG